MAQRRIFQKMAKMPEGILIWDKINAQLGAAVGKFCNLVARDRAPIAPDRFVLRIGKGVLGVELDLVDLPVGQVLDQFEECFETWHTSARYVEHNAATRKIGMVANLQTRQAASE